MTGGSKERYVLRGGRLGYERLALLARTRRADTVELLERVGLRAGMRCIDLGCGGGDVTFELALLVGREGSVRGLDMSEFNLALAREEAADRGVGNVDFRVANVDDWDEPDAYDFVYCRFVLEHLGQPVDLLRRMWAAVKPGGAIAAEDADFDGLFCEPANPGFEFYKQMYQRVLQQRGGDPTIGRRLHRYFSEAGIPDPELRVVQRVDLAGESKSMALSTLEATADAIVADGLSSDHDMANAIAQLAAFTVTPGTLVSGPRIFQLWARRPAEVNPAPSGSMRRRNP